MPGGQSKAFRKGARTIVVRPAQSFVRQTAAHQKMNVRLIDSRGIGEERKLKVFMTDLISGSFESCQRSSILPIRTDHVILSFV